MVGFMKFGLSDDVLGKLREIIKKYHYDFFIFGSRARGDYRNNSDIDIAVMGNVTEKDQIQIRNEFDALILPYMIDILFVSNLKNVELIKNIEREGVILS